MLSVQKKVVLENSKGAGFILDVDLKFAKTLIHFLKFWSVCKHEIIWRFISYILNDHIEFNFIYDELRVTETQITVLRILSNLEKTVSLFNMPSVFFLKLWASMAINLLSSVPFQFLKTQRLLAKFMKYCCLQVLFWLLFYCSISVLEPTGFTHQGLAPSWTLAIC